MRISIGETAHVDIEEFAGLLLNDLKIENFPQPEVLARGLEIVTEYMEGDKSRAAKWLTSEVLGLGSRRPLDVLRNDDGLEQVKRIIKQLEHGVLP